MPRKFYMKIFNDENRIKIISTLGYMYVFGVNRTLASTYSMFS